MFAGRIAAKGSLEVPTRRSVKGSHSSHARASVPAASAGAAGVSAASTTSAPDAANTTGARSAASVTNAASAANAASTANAANKSEKIVPEVPNGTSAAHTVEEKLVSGGKPAFRHSPLRILLIIAGSIFTLFIIACIALGVHRWCIYDDAQDIQGTWYIYNTKATVPIGQSTIGLSQDTEYNYTIDTQAKTITYSIGNLSGTSHYRFSLDRTQIALIEDGEKVFTATLFDDLSWWASSLSDYLSGKSVLPANEDSNVVILTRAESSFGEQDESDAGEGAGEAAGEGADAAEAADTANTAVQGEGASEASDTNA